MWGNITYICRKKKRACHFFGRSYGSYGRDTGKVREPDGGPPGKPKTRDKIGKGEICHVRNGLSASRWPCRPLWELPGLPLRMLPGNLWRPPGRGGMRFERLRVLSAHRLPGKRRGIRSCRVQQDKTGKKTAKKNMEGALPVWKQNPLIYQGIPV